ncbi:hypothetical protein CC79DRAFT_1124362 [Sarocladium strictum]
MACRCSTAAWSSPIYTLGSRWRLRPRSCCLLTYLDRIDRRPNVVKDRLALGLRFSGSDRDVVRHLAFEAAPMFVVLFAATSKKLM